MSPPVKLRRRQRLSKGNGLRLRDADRLLAGADFLRAQETLRHLILGLLDCSEFRAYVSGLQPGIWQVT